MSNRSASVAGSGQGVVTATHAAKNFGSILSRVREEGATYVVERSGTPVAEIGPVEHQVFTLGDFAELVRAAIRRSADEEYLRAVEEGVAFLNRPEIPESPWES